MGPRQRQTSIYKTVQTRTPPPFCNAATNAAKRRRAGVVLPASIRQVSTKYRPHAHRSPDNVGARVRHRQAHPPCADALRGGSGDTREWRGCRVLGLERGLNTLRCAVPQAKPTCSSMPLPVCQQSVGSGTQGLLERTSGQKGEGGVHLRWCCLRDWGRGGCGLADGGALRFAAKLVGLPRFEGDMKGQWRGGVTKAGSMCRSVLPGVRTGLACQCLSAGGGLGGGGSSAQESGTHVPLRTGAAAAPMGSLPRRRRRRFT